MAGPASVARPDRPVTRIYLAYPRARVRTPGSAIQAARGAGAPGTARAAARPLDHRSLRRAVMSPAARSSSTSKAEPGNAPWRVTAEPQYVSKHAG